MRGSARPLLPGGEGLIRGHAAVDFFGPRDDAARHVVQVTGIKAGFGQDFAGGAGAAAHLAVDEDVAVPG